MVSSNREAQVENWITCRKSRTWFHYQLCYCSSLLLSPCCRWWLNDSQYAFKVINSLNEIHSVNSFLRCFHSKQLMESRLSFFYNLSTYYSQSMYYHCCIWIPIFTLQVILLGDSGVGKTSFIVRYHFNEFKTASFSATVGISLTVRE